MSGHKYLLYEKKSVRLIEERRRVRDEKYSKEILMVSLVHFFYIMTQYKSVFRGRSISFNSN